MNLSQIVATIGGVLGMLAFIYTVARVGVRVDVLWDQQTAAVELKETVAVLCEKVRHLEVFNLHRAETEARIKRAIRDRPE